MLFAAVKQLKRGTKSCSLNDIKIKTYRLISGYMEKIEQTVLLSLKTLLSYNALLSGRCLEESVVKFSCEFGLKSWLQRRSN